MEGFAEVDLCMINLEKKKLIVFSFVLAFCVDYEYVISFSSYF